MRTRAVVLGCLLAGIGAGAQAAVLDFSGLQNGERPGQFYAGGQGSDGSVGGASRDLGVTFSAPALSRCNVVGDCQGGKQDILVFAEAQALTANPSLDFLINVDGGFTGDLAFNFATTQAGVAELWSGLSGTGVLLGTIALDAGSCPVADAHCSFRNASGFLGSSEIAHSIFFRGVSPEFYAIDDLALTLADRPISDVPEPAAWALMLSGFGLTGAGLRRRRRLSTISAALH